MNRWKILAAVAVTAVLGSAGGYKGVRGGQAEEAGVTQAPATVAVTRGGVQQTVIAPGRVMGTREVMLAMGAGGQLDEIYVRPGTVG